MKRQPESRVHERYLRHSKKFPNIWCAGCGIGIVLGAIIRAVDSLNLDKNDVAMISGIGCTGRMIAPSTMPMPQPAHQMLGLSLIHI